MSGYNSDLPIPTYEEALAVPSRAASDYGGGGGGGGGDAAEENEALLAHQSASASAPWRRSGSSGSGGGGSSGGGGGSGGGGSGWGRMDGYRPPTVESVRSSIESSFLDEFASLSSARSSAENLQREAVRLDVLDADGRRREDGGHGWGRAGEDGGRGLLRLSFSKRFSLVRSSLSAMSFLGRNPFRGLGLPRLPTGPCCARLDGAAMVAVYRLLAVLFALLVAYVLLATDAFSFRGALGADYLGPFDPDSVRNFTRREVHKARIRHWLDYLSSFDHLAGTEGDYVLAKYVQGQLASFGLHSERMRYDVYLNYPKPGGRRVWMAQPRWEAALEETADAADGGKTKKHGHRRRQNTMVFHGYSKSGTASGPVVFANYGSRDDFAALRALGINVSGAVVLMREGGTQPNRGLKVKAAQDHGAVGALLFPDRATEGWDWPDSAVQRGHVALSSWVVGDVLSPGLPAVPGSHQVPKANNKGLVNIPSLPLSYKDARPILDAIKGKGQIINSTMTGVEGYWSGSLAASPTVHLKNEQAERDRQPVWNVLGHIEGVDKLDEKIVLGSSRDAWCFGASDPNSGTAIMLEVARVFGKMMEVGWRPRRSVVFASWDGTQYNQVGPTEFVEEAGRKALGDSVLAYVNLGAAVAGAHFTASGSPAMQSVLGSVLGRVDHPLTHKPLNATWAAQHMPAPKAEGAHVPFQYHAGISSLDISFDGGEKRSPHHSCYDTFARMKDIVDPSFLHHEALARVVALLLVELADTDIIPLSMADYARALANYTADLEAWVHTKEAAAKNDGGKKQDKDKGKGVLDLAPLTKAVATAQGHMAKFSGRKEGWMDKNAEGAFAQNDDWAVANRRSRGLRMGNFDKHLADADGGLPAREWFKHAVLSPRAWGGPGAGHFPSIRDAVDDGNWELAQKEVARIAQLIERAARKLLDETTAT